MFRISAIGCIVIGCIISCNNKKTSPEEQQKISKQVADDTFNTIDIEVYPKLQPGIPIDTIRRNADKGKHQQTLVLPRLLQQELPSEYKKLSLFIARDGWMEEYAMGHEDSLTYATPTEDESTSHELQPLSLYKTRDVLSYSFESSASASGAMRHFFTYYTINYDFSLKKPISFDDFFITDKLSDKEFLRYAIIGRCLDLDDVFLKDTIGNVIMPDLRFSFDDEYVYFYVDMFQFMNSTGRVGSIKKKYILDYIKPAYR